MTYEYVLVMWLVNCTFGGCVKAPIDVQATYSTYQECKFALKDWTDGNYGRGRGGECIKVPAP